MPNRDTRTTYDGTQRAFHWSMAAIILVAIAIGAYAATLTPGTSPRRELLDVHKSLGMTALVLVVLRVIYRALVGEPVYKAPLAPAVHHAAKAAHWSLYALMIMMPVTGYIYSGAGNHSLPWFGVFSWPLVVPLDTALSHSGERLHYWGAWLIGALLAVHVLAAIWHQLVKRDEVLSRMAPRRS